MLRAALSGSSARLEDQLRGILGRAVVLLDSEAQLVQAADLCLLAAVGALGREQRACGVQVSYSGDGERVVATAVHAQLVSGSLYTAVLATEGGGTEKVVLPNRSLYSCTRQIFEAHEGEGSRKI